MPMMSREVEKELVDKWKERKQTNLVFTESSSTANPLKELSTSCILHHNTQMCGSQNHLQSWNHILNNRNMTQIVLSLRSYHLYRVHTSLKRIILWWRRLLWFMISLATFSSI